MLNFIFAILITNFCSAKGVIGTTGVSNSDVNIELTPQEFASRFQVRGDLFVTSADGKRLLYKISESRTGKPAEDTTEIYANWVHSHQVADQTIGIFMHYNFQIQKDGSVKVHIQQFDSMKADGVDGEVTFGKLIREEKMDLVNFSPINWVAFNNPQRRIIARLTPLLLKRVRPMVLIICLLLWIGPY